jgi:hypothetical protein
MTTNDDLPPRQPEENEPTGDKIVDEVDLVNESVARITDAEVNEHLRRVLSQSGYTGQPAGRRPANRMGGPLVSMSFSTGAAKGVHVPRYPQQDESRAILIGTGLYDNYDPLPAIANNLDTLRSVLISAKRGGFLPEHCHTISNPQEPGVLADHIRDVAEQATDVLLVYCTGHGVIDWETRKLQLALQHTREESLHYTALSIDLLNQQIAASPAKIKVLVLECCYSGQAIAGHAMSDVSGMLQQHAEMHGVYTLTSSAAEEISLAPPDAEFTAFSGIFIRLLREPPADHPAGATLAEMFKVLRRELVSRNYPEPQQSIENSGGELTLVGWDNGGDGDHKMPVVLVGPSAEDVPAAPGPAEDEHGPAVTPEVGLFMFALV